VLGTPSPRHTKGSNLVSGFNMSPRVLKEPSRHSKSRSHETPDLGETTSDQVT